MRARIDRTPIRRVALVLLLATLLGACSCATGPEPPPAPAPEPEPADTTDPADPLYRWGAFTAWSCNQPAPVIYVRASITDNLQYRALMAHERSHVAFALSFPSCEAYHRWREDPESTLTMEALATCAALRQRIRDGFKNSEEAVDRAAKELFKGSDIEGLTEERARKRLLAVCR